MGSSPKVSGTKEESGTARSTTIIVLILLAGRFVLHAILRRYSKGILKEKYLNTSLLFVTEALKCGIAVLMLEAKPGTSLREEMSHIISKSAPMMVPAGTYLVMNWLSLFAFGHVDASIFAMVQQLKILTTALFAMQYLGRSIPSWRLIVLCLLTTTVCSIAYRRQAIASTHVSEHHDDTMYFLGLVAIGVEVTLSGWVSNYFEKHLKDKTAGFSVWARNLQMSSYSMAFYIPLTYVELTSTEAVEQGVWGIFAGWSMVTCALALLGAATGFLVAFATKLTDAVTKTLATTMGLLLTYATEVALLGLSFDVMIAANSIVAVLAVVLYNQKLVPEVQAPAEIELDSKESKVRLKLPTRGSEDTQRAQPSQ